jgi:hypothetical protein
VHDSERLDGGVVPAQRVHQLALRRVKHAQLAVARA